MVTRLASPLFRDFVTLRDAVDRLFEESFVDPARFISNGLGSRTMPMEIYETPDAVIVKALVPGVSPSDLDATVQDGVLTIKAKTETPQANDDWNWHLREIGYGEFSRSVSLPAKVDVDQANSQFENGILTLTLPKALESRPTRISIQPAAQIEAGAPAESAKA
ncbi:MAG TPA: Hsp20/alpha crystallin family protein [Candidatus Limnocylindrales bacterium]|nr:Hsp20/alpha crystallin family protein [Candidatus Limnocylindrales bacterium]